MYVCMYNTTDDPLTINLCSQQTLALPILRERGMVAINPLLDSERENQPICKVCMFIKDQNLGGKKDNSLRIENVCENKNNKNARCEQKKKAHVFCSVRPNE